MGLTLAYKCTRKEDLGNHAYHYYYQPEISVRFVCRQQVTVEEARELEIRVTERFVEIINSHGEVCK